MSRNRNLKGPIEHLRAQGKTYDEIKAELGCSKSTISYYLGKEQKQKTVARSRGYKKAIDSWIQEYKETHPCADCGFIFHYWQMGFDHLPGMQKKFNISRYSDYTKKLDDVIAEIAKCEPVCHNCHSTRTHLRTKHDSEMYGVYLDEID